MLDPITDLYQYLVTQTDVTAHLGTYQGAPAIFAEEIPADHNITSPVIILDYPNVNKRRHSSSHIHRQLDINIRLFAQISLTSGQNSLALQQCAEAVTSALTTLRIPVSGGILRGSSVAGPVQLPTKDQTIAARFMTVTWHIQETSAEVS